MNNDEITSAMRGAAWERAKGELRSISSIGYVKWVAKDGKVIEADSRGVFMKKVEKFIEEVEDYDLHL